jgi:hypothetical protein
MADRALAATMSCIYLMWNKADAQAIIGPRSVIWVMDLISRYDGF